jgi:hypothetical protein
MPSGLGVTSATGVDSGRLGTESDLGSKEPFHQDLHQILRIYHGVCEVHVLATMTLYISDRKNILLGRTSPRPYINSCFALLAAPDQEHETSKSEFRAAVTLQFCAKPTPRIRTWTLV